MIPDVIGASTGPQEGLCAVPVGSQSAPNTCTLIAGVPDWKCPVPEADGLSFSLYDHKVGTNERNGDPNADVYAVVARPNNALLAVADGCSWGPKPRQAARCAVRGSIEYLNKKLFDSAEKPRNTQDVIKLILLSFGSAQKMIVENDGTTTTLCVAVVCELSQPRGDSGWALCVVSVGDSPCFVWQKKTGHVCEVTSAAHDGRTRDMRSSGGCLGTSNGPEPDLENLVCCCTAVAEGDIIFLTSDGISDNFDPVTRLEATASGAKPGVKPDHAHGAAAQNEPPVSKLPVLTPGQRHTTLLSNISKLLSDMKLQLGQQELSAWDVNDAVIKYVIEVTDAKRLFMEQTMKDIEDPKNSKAEKQAKESEFKVKLKTCKGKLDHATIVTYKISQPDTDYERYRRLVVPTANVEQSRTAQKEVASESHASIPYQGNTDIELRFVTEQTPAVPYEATGQNSVHKRNE